MSSFFSRFVLFRDNLKLTVCSWSVNSREGQLMTKKSVRSWTNHCVRENRDQGVRSDAVNRALLGKVSFDHTNFGRMTKLTFSFRFFGSYTLLECSQILTHQSSWREELLNELADVFPEPRLWLNAKCSSEFWPLFF